jgi:hypothetical protein
MVRDIAPDDPTHFMRQDLLMLRDWIVEKYRKILSLWPWSWLEVEPTPITTTVNQFRWPYPSDVRSIITVINTTNAMPMVEKTINWIERADPQRLVTGPPQFWTTWQDSQLWTWPIADGPYSLRYIYSSLWGTLGRAPQLDSDVINLYPATVLVYGVLAELTATLFASQPNQVLERVMMWWEKKYQDGIQEAIDTDRPKVTLPLTSDDAGEDAVWLSADWYRQHYYGPVI